jgi:uncharacterized membrane protein YeaQ/YmgE (transglycosylase-associated protein family)
MTMLIWIILGLVAGWLASHMMGSGRYGLLGDTPVGIAGAVAGGWLGSMLLGIDVTGFEVTSAVLAVAGAIVSIAAFRAMSPARRHI